MEYPKLLDRESNGIESCMGNVKSILDLGIYKNLISNCFWTIQIKLDFIYKKENFRKQEISQKIEISRKMKEICFSYFPYSNITTSTESIGMIFSTASSCLLILYRQNNDFLSNFDSRLM